MPSFHTFDEVQTWYVVFDRRRVPRCRFWHWFLPTKFSHVYMLREAAEGQLIILHPLLWGLGVQTLQDTIENYIVAMGQDATAVLQYTADYRRVGDYISRGLYNCVTLVKAVLGLTTRAFTPFGLYRHMLRLPNTHVIKPFVPYVLDSAEKCA